MFDPKAHLINMGKKEYLETKWRLVWFRDEHPNGQIVTDLVSVEPLIMKATVIGKDGGVLATGYGSAPQVANAIWKGREIEKAETAAIGRALGHAGYGTQFTDEDESDSLADSPVERPATPKKSNGTRPTPPSGPPPQQPPPQNGSGKTAAPKNATLPYGKVDGWIMAVAAILSDEHHIELSHQEVADETAKLVQARIADSSKTTIAELVAMLGNNRLAEIGNLDPSTEIRVGEHQPAMLMLGDLIDSPDLIKAIPQVDNRRATVNLLAKNNLFAKCETTPDMLKVVMLYIKERAKGTPQEKSSDKAVDALKRSLIQYDDIPA